MNNKKILGFNIEFHLTKKLDQRPLSVSKKNVVLDDSGVVGADF